MSILAGLNNSSSAPKSAAARNAAASADNRPQADVWLNIGYDVETTDPETGDTKIVFVNLPVGIPLDTMEPLAIRGQSESFADLRGAQNNLLTVLQAAADELGAGEEKVVNLTIKMRKRAAPVAAKKASDNSLVLDLAGIVG